MLAHLKTDVFIREDVPKGKSHKGDSSPKPFQQCFVIDIFISTVLQCCVNVNDKALLNQVSLVDAKCPRRIMKKVTMVEGVVEVEEVVEERTKEFTELELSKLEVVFKERKVVVEVAWVSGGKEKELV